MNLDNELEEVFPNGSANTLKTAAEVLSGNGGFASATETAVESGFYQDGESLNDSDQYAREIAAESVSDIYKRATAVANHAELAIDIVDDIEDRKELRKLKIKANNLRGRIENGFSESVYEDAEVPVELYRASD